MSLGIPTCNRSRPIGARLNKFARRSRAKTVHFSESFLGPLLRAAAQTPVEHVDGSRQDKSSRMGRFRSLFICGFNSYQKFDEHEPGNSSMAYKCTHCGHKQKLKVRIEDILKSRFLARKFNFSCQNTLIVPVKNLPLEI